MDFHPVYLDACKRQLDAASPGIWDRLDAVPLLSRPQAVIVVTELLSRACEAQNISNILIGRHGLSQIPRGWLVENVERIAESALILDDEWEYRRLLEVYELLDDRLLQRLVVAGRQHSNPDIREAATDFNR